MTGRIESQASLSVERSVYGDGGALRAVAVEVRQLGRRTVVKQDRTCR